MYGKSVSKIEEKKYKIQKYKIHEKQKAEIKMMLIKG